MIVRIAGRGHSFKGAGLYYLHDKESMTTDRVEWTHTRNMNVSNPNSAMNYMAYTAMNSNKLKQDAGIPLTGKKRTRGEVYTFSLSWSPEENPNKDKMMRCADETLTALGLQEHQAVLAAHNDTPHPHLHLIVNLVNPNDGRMKDPDWGSKLKMSDWALKYEFENGQNHCPERQKNHNKRKKGEQVRYKEPKHYLKEKIQKIYSQSDNGKSFKSALQEQGFTLATGNRRRFTLVDYTGKIYSLSRQLDKEQRKEHLQKLKDIRHQDLPIAQDIATDRQYFDRDKQNQEQLDRIEEGAIEKAKQEQEAEKQAMKAKKSPKKRLPFPANDEGKTSPSQPTPDKTPQKSLQNEQGLKGGNKKDKPKIVKPFHIRHDRISAWEDWADDKRQKLKAHQQKVYKRSEHLKKIKVLEKEIVANDNILGRMSGKLQGFKDELKAEKLTLKNVDSRIKEQTDALEKKIEQTKPQDYWGEQDNKPSPTIDLEQKKQSRDLSDKKQPPDKDQKRGYNLDR